MTSPSTAQAPVTTAPERRVHERRALRTTAKVVIGGAHTFEVRTIDISAGGVGIVAAANPRPGTVCRIVLALPLRAGQVYPLETDVQVMHSIFARVEDGFKVGLRFTNLDAATAGAIIQFLK